MSLILELLQHLQENFQQSTTGYQNRLKSLLIDFSKHIAQTEAFYKDMASQHGSQQAKKMANARLIKWYNQNYLSSRETGMGLSSLLRHFAQQNTGPIKKLLMDIADLPVYTLPDRTTGSRGAGDNTKVICANLSTAVESLGKILKDQAMVEVARKFRETWRNFQENTSYKDPNAKDKRKSEVVVDPEYKALHRTQTSGAEQVVNATLNRIPNEKLRHVIRAEVMKSDNKLAALDKLLVHYNIDLSK